MADVTTIGPADDSDPKNDAGITPGAHVPDAKNTEPEPVILEERIVETAPAKKNPAPAPTSPTTPEQPVQKPAPAPVSTPVPIAPKIEPAPPVRSTMQELLQSIKLPERHDSKASADVKVPQKEIPAAIESSLRPEPIVPEPAQPSAHDASAVLPFRTLKDDLQTIVREQKISLVHAVSLEEEKKKGQEHLAPEQKDIQNRRKRRTFGILFVAGLLIVLGAGAFFGVAYVMQERQGRPTGIPDSSILFSEQTVAFPLDHTDPTDLKAQLAQLETQSLGSLGSITRVVPALAATGTDATGERAATFAEFMDLIGAHPPDELLRAIGPDFFFGIHVVDKNAPLFVIPVSSYDHAFAGMLAWEATMDQDLSPIFTAVPATTLGADGLPVPRTFQDAILRNYDIRALKDDAGNIDLYYSFPTAQLLIIAQSPYSFPEILSRLQAERKL